MCCDKEPEKCPHWPALKRNINDQTVQFWELDKLKKRIELLENYKGPFRRAWNKLWGMFFGD